MQDPVTRIVDRLIGETKGASWEDRFSLFAAAVQAIVEAANEGNGMAADIYNQVHPKAIAQRLVEAMGEPLIVDRFQAAIYFLSPRHREISIEWQKANQGETLKLLAEMQAVN